MISDRYLQLLCLAALGSALHAATETDPVVSVDPVRVSESPVSGDSVVAADFASRAEGTLQGSALSDELPAFHVSGNGAFSFNDTFAVRGLSNTPIFGAPAATVYLDEIPLGGPFSMPDDLALLGGAELHYGPAHGSSHGRAGEAGMLQFTSAKLAAGETLRVRAFAGSHAAFGGSALFAQSWDGVAATVGLSHSQRDGYVRNTITGERIDSRERWGGLARLAMKPASRVELGFTAVLQRALDGSQPMVPLATPGFEVARSEDGRSDGRSATVGLTAAYLADWGRLSSTTSFTDWKLAPYVNILDFGFAELANDVSLKERRFNEEIKAFSKTSATLHWTVGAFLSDVRTEGAFTRAFGPMTYEASAYRIDAGQGALFGELARSLGGGFELGAGMRAEYSRARLVRTEKVPVPGLIRRTEESTAFLPRISLSWKGESSLVADLSGVAGAKPGGVSAFSGNTALVGFGPERLHGLEAGVRRAFLGGRLAASVRAHAYRITGYQIERSFATGGQADDYVVVNAPRASSLGLESSLSWSPIALLRLEARAGLTRATLREFTDPYTGVTYQGRRAPYAPASDASLAAIIGGKQGLFAQLRAGYTGRVYYTEGEEAMFSQASRTLLSGSVGYQWERARIALYGENLSDRRYWSSISPGTYHGTPGAPLTWGLEGSVRF